MSNDVNDFLFAGGAKAFQFNTIGDKCSGVIESADVRQQTSMEGEKLEWSDGSPRMQLVLTLKTAAHDTDDDDGLRTLYAKGGNFDIAQGSGMAMRNAIADAVKQSGAKTLDAGDHLDVAFSGYGVAKRGYQAPKLYVARFRKAETSVDVNDLFDD